MKFFRLRRFANAKVRYESEFYASRILNESLGSFYWMHKIDTWKLPKFERLFIGSIDSISNPMPWKSTVYWTLYLGTELRMYIFYMYEFYYVSRCLASAWIWLDFFTSELDSEYGIDMDVDPWEDLDDYDGEIEQDEDAWFFYHTQDFLFNSENPVVISWATIYYQVYNYLYYVYFVATQRSLIVAKQFNFKLFGTRLIKTCDNLLLDKLRSTFKTPLTPNVFQYSTICLQQIYVFFKTLITYSTKQIGTAGIFKPLNPFKLPQPQHNTLSKQPKQHAKSKVVAVTKPVVFGLSNANIGLSTLLRKQKVFTKSKYARSRQYCKNIVLLGLLLNIVLMFGLNLNYYTILINSGFFIYPLYFFFTIYSIFVIVKYKLYNVFKC